MNLVQIFTKYPDHEACIEHLEAVRWGDAPHCPHCGCAHVARKADGQRMGRWNCHGCKSSFNVLSGTIFEKTKVPLQKWFLAIALMVNAKKGLSSYQMGRDLDMNQKTTWRIMQCIRAQMMSKQQNIRLQGIVEADETYVGGKPRSKGTSKRGRGTNKVPVIGVVERGGNVVAQVAEKLTGTEILKFIQSKVELGGTLLMTDEFPSYRRVDELVPRAVIEHNQRWTDGIVHTNTIESFWALIKRAWMGQHHHYKKDWMPLYVAERCWMYNNRRNGNRFRDFVQGIFG